jgi:hypothetical protein
MPLLTLVGLGASPILAQKPDFSGAWKLNEAKTDAPMAGGNSGRMGPPAELFITQSDSKLVIEQKSAERSRLLTYYLDGRESKNPGMRGNEMVTKSTWVDNTIVTEGENTFATPNGEMKISTKEIRSLSSDGKSMTVLMTMVSPRGTMTRTMVYDR